MGMPAWAHGWRWYHCQRRHPGSTLGLAGTLPLIEIERADANENAPHCYVADPLPDDGREVQQRGELWKRHGPRLVAPYAKYF